MTTEMAYPARSLILASLIAALISIILWSGTFARITDANIGIDKDLVYIYFCGAEILHPSLHEQQTELVEHLVQAAPPAQEHFVFRARMRASYCDNYPMTSLSMYLAGKLQIYFGANDPAKDFPGFLHSSMRWGAGLSGAILGTLCLITVFWAARGSLMLAAFGAIVLAALLYVEVPSPALSWMLYVKPVRFFHIILLGVQTWLNPTAPFSPFSAFPRCLAAMIAFAAFILRWSGRGSLAYWTPILVSFVHQSEAPILLGMMICCDLLLRPQVLTRRSYILPITAGIIIIALRERMLSILGVPWLALGLTLVALAILTAAAVFMPRFRSAVQTLWRAINRLHSTLSQFSVPLAESIIILTVWFFVLLVCFACHHDNVYRVIYLWSELPPRFTGLFQLPVFAGLMYPVWVGLLTKRPNAPRVGFAVISCLAVILAADQWESPRVPKEVFSKNSQDVEATVSRGYAGTAGNFHAVETPFYYLMLRKALVGGDGISEYFAKH